MEFNYNSEHEISKEDIILAFEKVLPYLPAFFDDEISVAITDTEKFLKNQPCASIATKSKFGDPIPEGGAGAKVLRSGTPMVQEVPKEVYGVPFRSYAVPLKNDAGTVVGAILLAKNIERSKKLSNITNTLKTTFEQISDATALLSEEIQKLALSNQEIAEKSKEAASHTKDTGEVLGFVEKIATQSNLLGLNASIEAARAGEAGKGFLVVAQEIRKMSLNTTDSIKKINQVLTNIEGSISHISKEMNVSNDAFQSQTAVLEEITASMTEVCNIVMDLEEMAAKL